MSEYDLAMYKDKAKYNAAMRRYRKRRLARDPEFAAKIRAMSRASYRRCTQDPERLQRRRATSRKASSKWTSEGKQAAWRKKRYATDVNFRLRVRISNSINQYLRRTLVPGKFRPTQELVPWTIAELRAYLESLWAPGMSWNNYGKGPGQWSIDHTIAQSKFDFTKVEEIRKCWDLSNLTPMWHTENQKKSDNLQPQ